MPRSRHSESHRTSRIGWLRAAVLGANDGIVSTASLMLGVAAANVARGELLLAGVAALVAGAMSMAAGEYVSVSSQSDTEQADLARERAELQDEPVHEHQELAAIYVRRGLAPELAAEVSRQLMAHDALGAHAKDELAACRALVVDSENWPRRARFLSDLQPHGCSMGQKVGGKGAVAVGSQPTNPKSDRLLGISLALTARPVQAAFTSALTFAAGAALPLLAAWLAPPELLLPVVAGTSLLVLTALGALAARGGGAPILWASARVVFWGALAMTLTAAAGRLFGGIA